MKDGVKQYLWYFDENALDHVTNPFCGLSVLRYPPYREGASDGRGVHTDYSRKLFQSQITLYLIIC